MILEVSWDGLWTLSFGFSQFHGYRSWLMCEVALTPLHPIIRPPFMLRIGPLCAHYQPLLCFVSLATSLTCE